MAKARRVLAALKRDGWVIINTEGSHRKMRKGNAQATFAFHDRQDLGTIQLAQVASDFGYTLQQLRDLL
jgi:predicted RNA binding protein YcfA (HicA-like mRNA interferase family)